MANRIDNKHTSFKEEFLEPKKLHRTKNFYIPYVKGMSVDERIALIIDYYLKQDLKINEA